VPRKNEIQNFKGITNEQEDFNIR